MLAMILASENIAFSAALLLMLMIALLEGVGMLFGLGISNLLESVLPETDFSPHAEVAQLDAQSALSRFLGWLRVGQVPLLMLLMVFLLCFGLLGLIVQNILHELSGWLAPGWIAAPLIMLLSLPLVRSCGGLLQWLMPKDETTAVSSESLIGRIATITLGTAAYGYPAEARVKDQHGYSHYIQLEPDDANHVFEQGTAILVLSREGAIYRGIRNPNPYLTE